MKTHFKTSCGQFLMGTIMVGLGFLCVAMAQEDSQRTLPLPETMLTMEERLQMLESAFHDPEGFVALMIEHGPRLKDSGLSTEFNGLRGRFVEHQFENVCGGFEEGVEFYHKWVKAIESVYPPDDPNQITRIGNTAGSLLRIHGKKAPMASMAFCHQMMDKYGTLWNRPPEEPQRDTNYSQYMGGIITHLTAILSKIHDFPQEEAQAVYPEILALFDRYWHDRLIPVTAKHRRLASIANHIRSWGYPEQALAFLEKYLGDTPESEYRPDVLRELYFMHLNQFAQREKAKHYLDLYMNYDYQGRREFHSNPHLVEWASNNYYERFGLSDDQLKRYAAGLNHELKEKTRHIGEKLL